MESSSSEPPTHEFFEAWLNIYEATLGRLVEMPAVGPSREKYDKMMTGFSDSVNFYIGWMDLNSDFQKVFVEFQKYNREMLEENYLKQTNLPTKTDIDEINKELFALWKKTKELASQIDKLSGKGHSTL
jgi:hypothetical protein